MIRQNRQAFCDIGIAVILSVMIVDFLCIAILISAIVILGFEMTVQTGISVFAVPPYALTMLIVPVLIVTSLNDRRKRKKRKGEELILTALVVAITLFAIALNYFQLVSAFALWFSLLTTYILVSMKYVSNMIKQAYN